MYIDKDLDFELHTHTYTELLYKYFIFVRYWTIILPLYILVGVALFIVGYVGATLLLVPTPDSIHTLTGTHKIL